MQENAIELDTSGLNCPLPVLKLRKKLKELDSGEKVKVIATDPGSVKDFVSFCKQTGDTLLVEAQHLVPARSKTGAGTGSPVFWLRIA